ncbi:MAG: biotin--[Oscillospiraceae bacterium]|nr:biotin--[acetyl-CoA-carboxylase] ligase [Oscillospiraceae bacterium]
MKEQIRTFLPACPWRDSILYFDTIDSTNTQAKALAAQGAPRGTVLIADHQTGGRGRLGRSFLSPAGTGIYMSVIIRPNCPPARLMHLTCAVAVAMCDAVEAAVGFRPGIKWTNDLVYRGKKLAGVLTELGLSPTGTVDWAVIGVGINCLQRPEDFAPAIRDMAGSLAMFSSNVDRARVAAAMIDTLHRMDLSDKSSIMERYRADCMTLGKDVSLIRPGCEARHGKAVAIDDDGALVVEFGPGLTETVNSGEISVRGMYGYV